MGLNDNQSDREGRTHFGCRKPQSGNFQGNHSRAKLLAAKCLAAIVLMSPACGPSALEVYLEGQKLLGRAERGSCKLFFDKAEQSHVINGSRVYTCLNEVRNAYDLMLKGRSKGYGGLDVENTLAKVKDDIDRLESMYRMVSKMEMDKRLDGR